MRRSFHLFQKLTFFHNTLYFYKKYFLPITGFGLIAAFGRVVQLGGFGAITPAANVVLEVIIEFARVLLLLYVVGLANIQRGVSRIKHFFAHKERQKLYWKTALANIKEHRFAIFLNFLAFLLFAWIINYLIDLLAYETSLYLKLKEGNLLAQSASEWTIILFFKNISVIPFTLMFESLFVLWLFNKMKSRQTIEPV